MAEKVPEVLLMWVQSNERHKDMVVHSDSRPFKRELSLGDIIWSEKLNRYGTVYRISEAATFVRVGE